jgi:uncharacterized repeat protein (TIGR01451 family)
MNRFIRRFIFAMVFLPAVFCTGPSAHSQEAVTMYLMDQGWSGDTNFIELRCYQFQQISSFSLSIREVNSRGSFDTMDQVILPNFQKTSNYTYAGGTLTINWTSPLVEGYNVPDGNRIFRIRWIGSQASAPCYEIFSNSRSIKVQQMIFDTTQIIGIPSCQVLTAIPSFFSAYLDKNSNCSHDPAEMIFNYFTIQDSFNQSIKIYKNPQQLVYSKADYGRHYFKIIPINNNWFSCNASQSLVIDSTTRVINLAYGIQALISCPRLEVEVNTPIVRRCVDNIYYIRYRNNGTLAEDSTKIRIKLDPYMSLVSSSIPIHSFQAPYAEFSIGKLDVFESGMFTVTVHIDCNSTIVGQTHCLEAQILPHYDCFKSPLWSGASIEIKAICANGKASFRIENAGAEHMLDPVQYWIVEDDIMPGLKKDIKLNSGQFLDLEYPANGKTYRLIADQVIYHPGHSNPTMALEACGRDGMGNFSTGYFLMFPEDEEDPDIAIDCQASRGSFDPNDKIGLPLGYGADHYIEPGRSLEYKIRFQNIGNDTAFKVIIIDTLSEWMDLKTFQVLDASHKYSFQLVDRILTFRFDPIYLPYRSIDEMGSNGYVVYSIKPKEHTPLKTKITNEANIYFDFNPPILTNTTTHTLAIDFIIVSVDPADPESIMLNMYPNPGTDFLIIESESMSMEKDLRIYDATGKMIQFEKLNARRSKIQLLNTLTPGIYYVEIRDANQRFSLKKLIITKRI